MMTASGNDKLLSQNDKTRALRRMLINLLGLPQTIRPRRTCRADLLMQNQQSPFGMPS
jgi:hypothetical protein